DQRADLIGTEIRKLAGSIEGAETVAVAFLDRKGDDEGTLVRDEFSNGRNDPEVGIAFGQVEFAQQLAVESQPIGIVHVIRAQEFPPAALLGPNDRAQLAVTELLVPDEVDALDFGGVALFDFEDEVDAILLELDDLGL